MAGFSGSTYGALIKKIKEGGGISSYNDLKNKPKLNNVEVNGNKNSIDYNIYDKDTIDNLLASMRSIKVVEDKPTSPEANTMYYVGSEIPYDVYLYDSDKTEIYLGTSNFNFNEYQRKITASEFELESEITQDTISIILTDIDGNEVINHKIEFGDFIVLCDKEQTLTNKTIEAKDNDIDIFEEVEEYPTADIGKHIYLKNGEEPKYYRNGKWNIIGGSVKHLSVERLGEYTYKATFDNIPEYDNTINSYGGACTSFIRDGKLYRNLDFFYDNTAEFLVGTKSFTGMAFISGMNDGELEWKKIAQLPYHINDGVNRDGIIVSSHILYNDFNDYAGSGDKDKDITLLPYYILTNLHDIADINSTLSSYLANLSIPTGLSSKGYLMQYMVSDGITTKVITPKTDGSGYEIVDITALPKLANFKWVNKTTLERNDSALQDRPTGIERWNLIESGATLEELKFTLAYESNVRLSEFIGESGTTKDSTDAELQAIYNTAHTKYLSRSRNGELWQTCHSVVYDKNGIKSLFTQENYEVDYIASSGKVEDVKVDGMSVVIDKVANIDLSGKQDKNDNTLTTENKTVVGGINENKQRIDNLSAVVIYQGILEVDDLTNIETALDNYILTKLGRSPQDKDMVQVYTAIDPEATPKEYESNNSYAHNGTEWNIYQKKGERAIAEASKSQMGLVQFATTEDIEDEKTDRVVSAYDLAHLPLKSTGQIGEFTQNVFLLDNFVACDGTTEYDKVNTHKELYEVLNSKCPSLLLAGSDSNHFKIADLTGRYVRLDKDGDGSLVAGTDKTDNHTLTINEIPKHDHNISDGTTLYIYGDTYSGGFSTSASHINKKFNEQGGGQPHNHNLTDVHPNSITMIPQFRYRNDKVEIANIPIPPVGAFYTQHSTTLSAIYVEDSCTFDTANEPNNIYPDTTWELKRYGSEIHPSYMPTTRVNLFRNTSGTYSGTITLSDYPNSYIELRIRFMVTGYGRQCEAVFHIDTSSGSNNSMIQPMYTTAVGNNVLALAMQGGSKNVTVVDLSASSGSLRVFEVAGIKVNRPAQNLKIWQRTI